MNTRLSTALAGVLLLPFLAAASIIPQSGYSGRPGDGTCRDCHPTKNLVSADSTLIIGLPEAWQPETVYPCTLVFHAAGANFWSFELTVVDSLSAQAGQIAVADTPNTMVDTLDGILYFKNTIKGTHRGQCDSARWAFDYVAPTDGVGPVTFYWTGYLKNRDNEEKFRVVQNRATVSEACGE
jgi:hypothetical protein